MAAGSLPRPGTKYGPCVAGYDAGGTEMFCAHLDCAQTRAMAATHCAVCGEPIGYDDGTYHSRFYSMTDNPRALKHADCAEREAGR